VRGYADRGSHKLTGQDQVSAKFYHPFTAIIIVLDNTLVGFGLLVRSHQTGTAATRLTGAVPSEVCALDPSGGTRIRRLSSSFVPSPCSESRRSRARSVEAADRRCEVRLEFSVMTTYASPADLALVEDLRARLTRRQESLVLLRRRIEAARSGVHKSGRPLSSVNDISRRFMNAAAESEARGMSRRPVVTGGGGVGSLLSKWNEGFAMKEAQKERVTVRGDVRSATNKFSQADTSLAADVRAMKHNARGRSSMGSGSDVIEIEEDDVPGWAINQTKRVIQKENARAKTSGFNIEQMRGNVLNRGSAEIDTSGFREQPQSGNVGGAIAMWGRIADDQEAKEREERIRNETMRKMQSEFQKRNAAEVEPEPEPQPLEEVVEEVDTYERLDFEDSDDEEEEPADIRELIAYLERKCERVELKIDAAEHEMEKIDRLSQ
jgi:hypothetical protein